MNAVTSLLLADMFGCMYVTLYACCATEPPHANCKSAVHRLLGWSLLSKCAANGIHTLLSYHETAESDVVNSQVLMATLHVAKQPRSMLQLH